MYKAIFSSGGNEGVEDNERHGEKKSLFHAKHDDKSLVCLQNGALQELRNLFFWRAVFCEFIATTMFLLSLTLLLSNVQSVPPSTVTIGLSVGLSISCLIQIFGPVCGAHLNPAVSIGVFVQGNITTLKCFIYILVQHIGAICGTAITYLLLPQESHGVLGSLSLSNKLSTTQGFFIEMIFTMWLVVTVLASTSDDNGRRDFGFSNALAIGISVTVVHFFCVPLTGSGINPARAIGSAVIIGEFPNYFWIYWIAPTIGGVVGGLFYRFVLQPEKQENQTPSSDDPEIGDEQNADSKL